MSRLLVDDVTKTDARALLNVNKMATISDIVAPSNEYIYASGANELTVVEGCVIAVGGAGIFKTANTILTAANLDAGSAFAVGKDYYVYICDSRIDSADEKYVISLNSTYPTGWNATNSRKIGGFHYGRCRKVDSNLQPLNGSSVIFGTSKEVLKETTAWLLTNAMQDVITSGTGSGAGLPNMPTAGKTGTTTKNRDTVFAGYTPYYTAAVWGGYDDNTEQTYTAYSKLIWHSVMQRIHENLPRKEFTQPSGIVTATVCKKSGKLAIEGVCDADPRGSMVYTEYFDKDSVPTETCDHHVKVDICSASGQIAGEYCPVGNRVPTVYIIGGTAETEDGPYLITEEALNTVCSVHTSSSSSSESGTTEGTVKPSVEGTITENKPQTENSGEESSTGGSSGSSSGGSSGGTTGGSSGDTGGTGTNTPSTQTP